MKNYSIFAASTPNSFFRHEIAVAIFMTVCLLSVKDKRLSIRNGLLHSCRNLSLATWRRDSLSVFKYFNFSYMPNSKKDCSIAKHSSNIATLFHETEAHSSALSMPEISKVLIQVCGCLKSHSKHMLSKSKLYNVWKQINQRCTNSRCMQFKYYGGRGILVCDEWINDFQAFHDWAIENGYKSGLTIDRINNDGNYTPENCQWVTMKIQGSNRRRKGTAL